MQNNKIVYVLSKEESEYIDYLKALLCIMVVMIHSYCLNINYKGDSVKLNPPFWTEFLITINSHIICECAVPAFFVISSILLYRKHIDIKENLRKKAKSLLVPYFIINSLCIVFYAVIQSIPVFSSFFSSSDKIIKNWELIDFFNAYLGLKSNPIYPPYWFIKELFILNTISGVIKKFVDKFPRIMFIMLSIGVMFDFQTHFFLLSFSSLVYFVLGYYIVKYDVHIERILNTKAKNYILIVTYILMVNINYIYQGSEINKRMMYLTNILGIGIWYLFIRKKYLFLKESKLVNKIKKYNFFIYSFHMLPVVIGLKVWTRLFSTESGIVLLLEYFSVPFIVIIGCIVFAMTLECKMPFIYYVISGIKIRSRD